MNCHAHTFTQTHTVIHTPRHIYTDTPTYTQMHTSTRTQRFISMNRLLQSSTPPPLFPQNNNLLLPPNRSILRPHLPFSVGVCYIVEVVIVFIQRKQK